MSKRNKIIYWIATIWLAFGMAFTGSVQLIRTDDEIELMNRIGFPVYFLTILGTWKLLGAIAILVPKFPLIKEWAYAGFFFVMTGAMFSHIALGDSIVDLLPSLLLLVLTGVSWYFRPPNRKIVLVTQ